MTDNFEHEWLLDESDWPILALLINQKSPFESHNGRRFQPRVTYNGVAQTSKNLGPPTTKGIRTASRTNISRQIVSIDNRFRSIIAVAKILLTKVGIGKPRPASRGSPTREFVTLLTRHGSRLEASDVIYLL